MTKLTQPFASPTILIVGGGFAGAVLTIRLLEQGRPLRIVIAEPRQDIGRGVAYSTTETVHLVNGPTSHFSLYPQTAPDHLADWVRAHGTDGDWTPPAGDLTDTFIPRRVFGSYVLEELNRAIAAARDHAIVQHLREDITALTREAGRLVAVTSTGQRIAADQVVLATGVFGFAEGAATLDHPRHVRNPWDPKALDQIADARDVLLVGSSLSMVDMVASLEARGYRGRYHAISRRGHLIQPRRLPTDTLDFLNPDALPKTTRSLLRLVNARRKEIVAAGGDWQAVLSGLRGHILPLWQGASATEQLRFNRHLRALWDVSLHRAAPGSFAAVEHAQSEGRFTASAARLIRLQPADDGIVATIRPRGARQTLGLQVGAVIDCRGHQEHDWRRVSAPLPRQLLASGAVRSHETGLGIDATKQGEVIGRDGAVWGDLFALGHPLRGVAWESSSIPEQLTQSAQLANLLQEKAEAEDLAISA